jgi:hypothetical protein
VLDGVLDHVGGRDALPRAAVGDDHDLRAGVVLGAKVEAEKPAVALADP